MDLRELTRVQIEAIQRRKFLVVPPADEERRKFVRVDAHRPQVFAAQDVEIERLPVAFGIELPADDRHQFLVEP